jgi:hypothetical protein
MALSVGRLFYGRRHRIASRGVEGDDTHLGIEHRDEIFEFVHTLAHIPQSRPLALPVSPLTPVTTLKPDSRQTRPRRS